VRTSIGSAAYGDSLATSIVQISLHALYASHDMYLLDLYNPLLTTYPPVRSPSLRKRMRYRLRLPEMTKGS
jgi:hypothetical protein